MFSNVQINIKKLEIILIVKAENFKIIPTFYIVYRTNSDEIENKNKKVNNYSNDNVSKFKIKPF